MNTCVGVSRRTAPSLHRHSEEKGNAAPHPQHSDPHGPTQVRTQTPPNPHALDERRWTLGAVWLLRTQNSAVMYFSGPSPDSTGIASPIAASRKRGESRQEHIPLAVNQQQPTRPAIPSIPSEHEPTYPKNQANKNRPHPLHPHPAPQKNQQQADRWRCQA